MHVRKYICYVCSHTFRLTKSLCKHKMVAQLFLQQSLQNSILLNFSNINFFNLFKFSAIVGSTLYCPLTHSLQRNVECRHITSYTYIYSWHMTCFICTQWFFVKRFRRIVRVKNMPPIPNGTWLEDDVNHLWERPTYTSNT